MITAKHLLLSESKKHIRNFANPRAPPGSTRMPNIVVLKPLSFGTILYFLFISLFPIYIFISLLWLLWSNL